MAGEITLNASIALNNAVRSIPTWGAINAPINQTNARFTGPILVQATTAGVSVVTTGLTAPGFAVIYNGGLVNVDWGFLIAAAFRRGGTLLPGDTHITRYGTPTPDVMQLKALSGTQDCWVLVLDT